MKRLTILFISAFLSIFFLCGVDSQGAAFTYHWEMDESPEGSESATVVEPVQVTLLDEQIQVPSHSGSLALMRKYSVHLGPEWSPAHAYRLLQTFESIPQRQNDIYTGNSHLPASVWRLSNRHLQDDIDIEYSGEERIVTVSEAAFVHAMPLLAEIDGTRGRYFSKRLHRAVVRFVTDNGSDRRALDHILEQRYGVGVRVPDYTELTRYTTQEHVGSFQAFKDEELIAIASMLEEFPSGMLTTPGLKHLIRRLDGLPHPVQSAAAVAWVNAGYIEFMESAFQGTDISFIHRLVLHEKAHFLWEHLFDAQLKQDWIEVGGWYENPDDKDGWSTTKQVEFVSAYAHGKNPNEDMAESISFYITNPDKLRSRSPAKYEFIRDRVMHGTRYISKIREDLTFEVYNLWPDYVYPGRIIGIDIQVTGAPEEDKQVTIKLQLHGESNLDTATRGYTRIWSGKGTSQDIHFYPIDANGQRIDASHVLQSHPVTLSRYAAGGYWTPDTIQIGDRHKNERYSSQTDFGWKLYIDNPLADCEPPQYMPNSMRLSLWEEKTDRGERYQIIEARWYAIDQNRIRQCRVRMNDEHPDTYSLTGYSYLQADREIIGTKREMISRLVIPDYKQSGTYTVVLISMSDVAGNSTVIYFTEQNFYFAGTTPVWVDEAPTTIEIQTRFPDATPPELDLNAITIKAEPTRPEAPNGETRVDITFRVRDNISGYHSSSIRLRDPQGETHGFSHYGDDHNQRNNNMYFTGDPTVYRTYEKTIILPVGSPPGTWGLAEMNISDMAGNFLRADFTEIVRFEVNDAPIYAESDINQDGTVNIQDLVLVANQIGLLGAGDGEPNTDINADGVVDILDLVQVANDIGEESAAAPAIHNLTTEQIQSWLIQLKQIEDGSPDFRRAIHVLENLLRAALPETTVLLANYPNPFNPETWIPYQLAAPADVTLTIYAVGGQVVRTLELGLQSAGIYQDKSRAAYWDGKNAFGESVASGMYFYTLTAGNFTATRKLLIRK
ncbi:MAG: T9SS type A sorting domain-containing protein [Candidatus Poribacteria bacterium]|nr:T9SS type A sorting domain-containing protein [Candidatus Poribacteria bacterium]